MKIILFESINIGTIKLRNRFVMSAEADNLSTEAGLVSLCRPLIREPGLINYWRKGDTHRARCISCNKCAMALAEGKSLSCSLDN